MANFIICTCQTKLALCRLVRSTKLLAHQLFHLLPPTPLLPPKFFFLKCPRLPPYGTASGFRFFCLFNELSFAKAESSTILLPSQQHNADSLSITLLGSLFCYPPEFKLPAGDRNSNSSRRRRFGEAEERHQRGLCCRVVHEVRWIGRCSCYPSHFQRTWRDFFLR